MDKEPSDPQDSAPPEVPPEEPVTPVPTSETTPVWAQTRPVAPAEDAPDAQAEAGDDEPLPPAIPMQKGDPDWSASEGPTNGEANKGPEWAQTVPTSPGDAVDEGQPEELAKDAKAAAWSEAVAAKPAAPAVKQEAEGEPEPVTEAPITEPPKAVAADAVRKTWPPRSETSPAPPVETDIWPPEPPTEPAMPAWPPSSDLAEHAHEEEEEEEPVTPAQAIPSWPDSFDETAAAVMPEQEDSTAPTITPEPAAAASTPPAAQVTQPETATPAPSQAPTPPAMPASQPAWAPNAAAEVAPVPHKEQAPSMQIPSWAPRVPLASEPGTPTWFSPKEQIPHATAQPVAAPTPKPEPPPAPPAPVEGGQLPVAPVPAPAPAQPEPAASKPSWQVVQQAPAAKGPQGPTAEDRSYAEWFAWAKRGGAPASACHAAAQGAFKALSSGKDVNTAVQWATAAMGRPPENVSYARQTYCAWYALANIDLNMDQHRSHLFAGAAVQALDGGMDASQAHAAGLHAAGYR